MSYRRSPSSNPVTAMSERPISVIYNGECPICRREIEVYQRLARREGLDIDWQDLVETPEILDAHALTADQAARRLHVVDTDGQLLSGVEAFARLWRELPGFGWLARLVRFPLIRPFAFAVYEGVLGPFLYWLHKRRQARKPR